MTVIKFGRWSFSSDGNRYVYDRIYWSGHRWTPFCKRSDRAKLIMQNALEEISLRGELLATDALKSIKEITRGYYVPPYIRLDGENG